MRRAAGFTLVELVTVMIVLGILAAVAIPRMDTGGYRALEFHDRTVAALRYAQKTATSHRRPVCVAFTATTVALTIDNGRTGACGTALNLPGSSVNVVTSGDAANASFNPVPPAITFASDGTATAASLSIANQPAIAVAATGYVQ